MQAFEVLADPVRRRILELLVGGEQRSGAVTQVVRAEFAVSQPAVSQHLKVLRDNGFATVRSVGTRRLYALTPAPLAEVEQWLVQFRPMISAVDRPGVAEHPVAVFLDQRLDALATELARGQRARRAGEPGGDDRTNAGRSRTAGERNRTGEERTPINEKRETA